MSDAQHSFDIDAVSDHFERSLIGDDDVDLPLYVAAYRELNKLFTLLGAVFAFVRSDVEEKESILADLYASNPKHYASVRSMISWECRHGMPEEKVSWLCRRSYERTLSKYHGWLIRKGVEVASYTLSSRRLLVQTIVGPNGQLPSEERVNEAIRRMLNGSTLVCERVQQLFTRNHLLNLP